MYTQVWFVIRAEEFDRNREGHSWYMLLRVGQQPKHVPPFWQRTVDLKGPEEFHLYDRFEIVASGKPPPKQCTISRHTAPLLRPDAGVRRLVDVQHTLFRGRRAAESDTEIVPSGRPPYRWRTQGRSNTSFPDGWGAVLNRWGGERPRKAVGKEPEIPRLCRCSGPGEPTWGTTAQHDLGNKTFSIQYPAGSMVPPNPGESSAKWTHRNHADGAFQGSTTLTMECGPEKSARDPGGGRLESNISVTSQLYRTQLIPPGPRDGGNSVGVLFTALPPELTGNKPKARVNLDHALPHVNRWVQTISSEKPRRIRSPPLEETTISRQRIDG